MVWSTSAKAASNLINTLERIAAEQQLSRKDHLQLTSALLGSQHITEDLRRKINHILDELRSGRLKLVD
ncbi:hypothetical protein ACQ4M4_00370 [Leptolyngbya sp. AN02str]|uniref:hypothetical protein n=1 Tax=Leptolyngbya sp. AN02str TaxID=3423363 RepID=UPI003D31D6F0